MDKATTSNTALKVPIHPEKNFRRSPNEEFTDFYKEEGSDLSRLCKSGSVQEVYDEIVLSRPNLNKLTDAHAPSMLYISAEHNNHAAVEVLLTMNAEVNFASTIAGACAVHVAAQEGLGKMVLLLLKHRADVNAADTIAGSTPLMLAVQNNRPKMASLLIDQSADVNRRSFNFSTPLLIAAEIGANDLVQTLRRNGADSNIEPEHDGAGLLFYSARSNNEDLVSYMLGCGYAASHEHEAASALYIASKEGYLGVVDLLLRKYVHSFLEVCSEERYLETPIDIAAFKGHLKIVMMMVEAGASIGLTEGSAFPLFNAARNNQYQMVCFLLERGADVNMVTKDQKYSALYIAAKEGHTSVVSILLQNRADVHRCTHTGESPLHAAASFDHISVLRALLKFKADVNQAKRFNENALIGAVKHFRADVVTVLLEHGGDVFQVYDRPIYPRSTAYSLAVISPSQAQDNIELFSQKKIKAEINLASALIRYLSAEVEDFDYLIENLGKVVVKDDTFRVAGLIDCTITPEMMKTCKNLQGLIFSGAIQKPFTQWASRMLLERKISLFTWARNVDRDMRSAFRLIHIQSFTPDVSDGNTALSLWKSVLSLDRFPGICQVVISFIVLKSASARWIIREMASYCETGTVFVSEPAEEEHLDAFASSLVVRNRREKLERERALAEALRQSTERIRAIQKRNRTEREAAPGIE